MCLLYYSRPHQATSPHSPGLMFLYQVSLSLYFYFLRSASLQCVAYGYRYLVLWSALHWHCRYSCCCGRGILQRQLLKLIEIDAISQRDLIHLLNVCVLIPPATANGRELPAGYNSERPEADLSPVPDLQVRRLAFLSLFLKVSAHVSKKAEKQKNLPLCPRAKRREVLRWAIKKSDSKNKRALCRRWVVMDPTSQTGRNCKNN